MSKCWALKPSDRPSFSELVFFMCDQLTDREEKVRLFQQEVINISNYSTLHICCCFTYLCEY